MEAQYKTADGRLLVKFDSPDTKGLFRQIAAFQASFEAESECGMCKSKQIAFNVRTVDDSEYFELACSSCGAKFNFGQHKKGGGLFPKRKNEKGEQLQNRGWQRWGANQNSSRSSQVKDEDVPF